MKFKRFIVGVLVLGVLVVNVCGVYGQGKSIKHKSIKQMITRGVIYDSVSRDYLMKGRDENGEIWLIELVKANKVNRILLRNLNRSWSNQWILATVNEVNDKATKDIYDDEVLKWCMLD